MALPAFDTLKFVETLTESGISDTQARALLKALGVVLADAKDDLATKTDLKTELLATKVELKTEIQAVKTEFNAELAATKTELRTEIEKTKTELRTEIQAVKTELKSEIQETKTDIKVLKWMISLVITGIATLILKTFF